MAAPNVVRSDACLRTPVPVAAEGDSMWDLALKYVAPALRAEGFEVLAPNEVDKKNLYAIPGEIDRLNAMIRLGKAAKPDLYLSLHSNAFNNISEPVVFVIDAQSGQRLLSLPHLRVLCADCECKTRYMAYIVHTSQRWAPLHLDTLGQRLCDNIKTSTGYDRGFQVRLP